MLAMQDSLAAMRDFARPGSSTRAAAVGAVEALAVQAGAVLRVAMQIRQVGALQLSRGDDCKQSQQEQ